VIVGGLGSGTGSTLRLICCATSGNGSKLDAATSKCITAEFLITISDFIVIGLAFQFHSLSQNIRWWPVSPHDVVLSAARMLKPDCVIRARGHRQTEARHEEDKARPFRIRDPNFIVLIFPVGSKR
jgi:hypothetical protein